jgi:NADPH:quinone reductase
VASSTRAVVVDRAAPDGLALRPIELPPRAVGEARIRVTAISLNRGEVRRALAQSEDGARPGWDFAGIVA